MKMTFKTNLKCNGCVQSVRPNLESLKGISNWEVDLNSPDRWLTIEGEALDEEKIVNVRKAAGYQAERVQ